MEIRLVLKDIEATRELAGKIAGLSGPGDVILLFGDLGTGKTAFVKAFCRELGVPQERVTSPSFSLLHVYDQARVPVVHVDLYRLGRGSDPGRIGLDEYLDGLHIVLVEWADYLVPGSPWVDDALSVHLEWLGETARKVRLVAGESGGWAARIGAAFKDLAGKSANC